MEQENTTNQLHKDVAEKYRFSRRDVQQDVVALSKVSTIRGLGTVAWQWVMIFAAATVAFQSQLWWVYVIAGVFIATRMHALGVLIHDAAHYRLAKSRRLNDVISDFFCAHPLMGSTRLYRDFHLNHHRYTNTDRDPEVQTMHGKEEFTFPKTRLQLAWLFMGDVFAWNSVKTASITLPIIVTYNFFRPAAKGGLDWDERLRYLLFLGLQFSVVGYFGLWWPLLLLWIVPGGLAGALYRLRMIAEHHAVPNDREINGTRTVLGNWFERTFICPLNVNYHLEHHMFPSVPFYNLGKLHDRLMREEAFARKAHITKTYLFGKDSVLGELTTS